MRIKNKARKLSLVYQEMKDELEQNSLQVILVPCENANNPGACIRKVVSSNCDWYRQFCSQFPSTAKTRSKEFRTKIKRKNTIDLLNRLIWLQPANSKYAKIIEEYAEERLLNYENKI